MKQQLVFNPTYLDTTEKDEKLKLKNLDKLYNKLVKSVPENVAESLLTMISKNGAAGAVCYSIVADDEVTLSLYLDNIKGIEYFENIIKKEINLMIMSALRSPGIFKKILEFRDRVCPLVKDESINDEMLSCIYRHMFKFPENKELCISTLKKYKNTKNNTLNKPFAYSLDNADLIADYFVKDNNVRDFIVECCISCGSVNILKKAIKYYKVANLVYCKFNPTILYKLKKEFDIEDEDNKFYILNDICINSKWDYLPSIFESGAIKKEDFIHFRFTLYQGLLNFQFIKTLLYYMKKYDFDYELLRDSKAESLKCDMRIKKEFEDNNILPGLEIYGIDIMDKQCDEFVGSLFEAYLNGCVELIKVKMISINANFNNRFKDEITYANDLVINNKLNWDEDMTQKYKDFYKMCMDFCDQMNVMNDVVLEYNSLITIYNCFNEMVCLRFLNKLKTSMTKITDEYLAKHYKIIYENFNGMMNAVKIRVKKFLGLNIKEEWNLPENPTLEHLFIDLYLNSEYKEKDDATLTYYIKQTLERKKFTKILEEVYCAIAYSVSIDEIHRILRLKNIV